MKMNEIQLIHLAVILLCLVGVGYAWYGLTL